MRINRRQQLICLLGGVIVFLFLYYLFVVGPAVSKDRWLGKRISKNEEKLTQMVKLSTKWEKFKEARSETKKTLAERGKNFTLLSFLEGVSRKIGIHDKIQYMKPLSSSEETGSLKLVGMEIQLDNISVGQLVKFLYEIEYSNKLVNIKRLKIQKLAKDNFQSLRVILQVDTYVSA